MATQQMTPPETGVTEVHKETVGRDDLMAMVPGQWTEFFLPEPGKLESVRSACQGLKIYGRKYTTMFHPETTSILVGCIE